MRDGESSTMGRRVYDTKGALWNNTRIDNLLINYNKLLFKIYYCATNIIILDSQNLPIFLCFIGQMAFLQ